MRLTSVHACSPDMSCLAGRPRRKTPSAQGSACGTYRQPPRPIRTHAITVDQCAQVPGSINGSGRADGTIGNARGEQAPLGSGRESASRGRRRSYQCQVFIWGSGVKTADTTMTSHSNAEGMPGCNAFSPHSAWARGTRCLAGPKFGDACVRELLGYQCRYPGHGDLVSKCLDLALEPFRLNGRIVT